MVGLLKRHTLGAVALLSAAVCAAESPSRHTLEAGFDIGLVNASGYTSWTRGAAGKLRYDPDSDGVVLSRAFLDYKLRLFDTVNVNVVADLQDDFGPTADLTEAYAEWRPLTLRPTRLRLRAGAFYPRISLENGEAGWSSPYSMTPSVLNTWVGEEIRVLGAEATLSRRPVRFGGAHTFSVTGAVFNSNDTAGTLLSWKGWSAHDRQARLGDKLPLPAVPQIQPGGFFQRQDPYTRPFMEVDDAAGYYLAAEWIARNRWLLRTMHYDNRADPRAADGGQFGWRTVFEHVGFQAALPGDIGLVGQWMHGSTDWGRRMTGERAVYAKFDSHFLLVTRAFGEHRLTLRYDRFEIADEDGVPNDDNAESGHAWMAAWRTTVSRNVSIVAEWLEVRTRRNAWAYFGLEPVNTETQLQLGILLRFGNHR